jgi:hypothetical protein
MLSLHREINTNNKNILVMATKVNTQKVNVVYRTSDYSIFGQNVMNRDIIPPHVENLYKDMLVNGWLCGSYIVMNTRGKLVDGHHRLLAAMKCGIPVNYIVEDVSDEAVSSLNKLTRNWSIIDHLKHYVKLENQNYVLLDRFMKNFPTLRPTEAMMLVRNCGAAQPRHQFETGKFEVKDMKLAYNWGHQIMSIKPYFENGYNKSIFVRALVKVFLKPEFDFDEFLHKIKLRPSSIFMCGTVDQYLEMIENIYNYRRKVEEKVNLRF